MEGLNSVKNQWQRAKSGQPVTLAASENRVQEFNGGLVIIGLEQQKKEQRDREEALHMETQLSMPVFSLLNLIVLFFQFANKVWTQMRLFF